MVVHKYLVLKDLPRKRLIARFVVSNERYDKL
jgi:hypothetical protein